jgi:hypothetical protein
MTTGPNVPLQKRAGANVPGIFSGVLYQASEALKKVTQKVGVIYANDDSNTRFVLSDFSPGVSVYNGTTDPVDIELVLENSDGRQVVLDTASAIAPGATGTINSNGPGFLAEGEKILYRVTSAPSITTGTGLVLLPTFSQADGIYGKDNYIQRITLQSPTIDLQTLEGLSGLGGIFGASGFLVTALNYGTSDVTLNTVSLLSEDESVEIPQAPATLCPAGVATPLTTVAVLVSPNKTRLTFSGLPTGGPLVLAVDAVFPFNEGPLDLLPGV